MEASGHRMKVGVQIHGDDHYRLHDGLLGRYNFPLEESQVALCH